MADELKTIPIKAPRLNQPGYGSNIEKVFENIDANFRIVGNHDFVKGNTGNCVGSESIRILNGDRFTPEGMLILNAIIQQIDSTIDLDPTKNTKSEVKVELNEYAPLRSVQTDKGEISLIDGFTEDDFINLIILYDPMYKEDTKKYIGATNDYLFRDPRFVYLVDDAQGQYSSLYDCSCTVHMQLQSEPEDEFVCRVIQNAPTLYYDSTQQTFCWKIGGRETGIIAQGPQGESGVSAFTYIVRVESTGNEYGVSGSGELRKIKGYIDPKTVDWEWIREDKDFPSDWKGSTCLALSYTESESLQGVYVSIISEGNKVFCNDNNNLPTTFDVNSFMSAMAQINAAGGSENRGLFVPMGTPPIDDEDGKMSGSLHAIWSAKNPNEDIASELHISPIKSGMPGVREAYNALRSSSTGAQYVTAMSDQVVEDARLFADYRTIVLDGPANEGNARLGIGTDDFNGLGCGISIKSGGEIRMPNGTISATDGLKIEGDTVIYNSLQVKRTAKMSILSVSSNKNNIGEMVLNGNATFNGVINIQPDNTEYSTKQIYGSTGGQNLRIWNPNHSGSVPDDNSTSAIQLVVGKPDDKATFGSFPAGVEISTTKDAYDAGSGTVTVNGETTFNGAINTGKGKAINIRPVNTNYSTKQIYCNSENSSQNLRIWNPDHTIVNKTSAIQLVVGKPDTASTFDGFPASVEISTKQGTQDAGSGTIKMNASSVVTTGDLTVKGVANLLMHGYKQLGSEDSIISDRCFYIYRKGTSSGTRFIHFDKDVYHAGDIVLISNHDVPNEETFVAPRVVDGRTKGYKLNSATSNLIVFKNATYTINNQEFREIDHLFVNAMTDASEKTIENV